MQLDLSVYSYYSIAYSLLLSRHQLDNMSYHSGPTPQRASTIPSSYKAASKLAALNQYQDTLNNQSAAFNAALESAKDALARGSKVRLREVIDKCRKLYLSIIAKEAEAAKTDITWFMESFTAATAHANLKEKGMALKRMDEVMQLWRQPLRRVQTRLDEEAERWEEFRKKEVAKERIIYDDGHWHDGYASRDYDVSDWWAK